LDIARVAEAEAVLLVAPAQHVRGVLEKMKPHVSHGTPLVLCAKGIETGTGLLLTETLAEILPEAEPAILSGPSFARDVARGLPTAVTIAARPDIAARLQASLSRPGFRPYASEDLIGVALGGAAKNVTPSPRGMVEGAGWASARGQTSRGFAS
jgi:glycerol-3-phosphate dehydrogenase (NAD(P)+)